MEKAAQPLLETDMSIQEVIESIVFLVVRIFIRSLQITGTTRKIIVHIIRQNID